MVLKESMFRGQSPEMLRRRRQVRQCRASRSPASIPRLRCRLQMPELRRRRECFQRKHDSSKLQLKLGTKSTSRTGKANIHKQNAKDMSKTVLAWLSVTLVFLSDSIGQHIE